MTASNQLRHRPWRAGVHRTLKQDDEIDDDRRYQQAQRGNQDPRRGVGVRDDEIPTSNRDDASDTGPESGLEGIDPLVSLCGRARA